MVSDSDLAKRDFFSEFSRLFQRLWSRVFPQHEISEVCDIETDTKPPSHVQSRDTVRADRSGNINIVRIELGEKMFASMLLLAAVIGVCGLVMGLNLSKQDRQDQSFKDMKTQMWLVERRLMDREALDIINGQRLPSDTEWGPTGNMERMKPKEK